MSLRLLRQVECYAFFAEVAEVTVVGGNCELAFGNTVAFEEFGNAFCTVFAESHVNIVGAGVVISPSGNGIFFYRCSESSRER